MEKNLMDALQGSRFALQRQLEDEKNRHLRTLADFENFRKRVERDACQASLNGKKDLAGELLAALDSLELAMGQVRDEVTKQGLYMVYREFTGIMAKHGLEPVDSVGQPFDPCAHEGAGYLEGTGFPPGYVARELRRGYRFGGELLRPATVMVASGQVNK